MKPFAAQPQLLRSASLLLVLATTTASYAADVTTPMPEEMPPVTEAPAPDVTDVVGSENASAEVNTPAPEAEVTEPTLPAEYGPTKKGDAIMGIAKRLAAEGPITADQLAWAMYQSNKAAFEAADITRLRAGQTLAIPALDEIQATESDAAKSEIEKLLQASRNRPAPKPKDPVVAKLRSQIAETKRDSEENAKEQALLKRRLQEIEKEIQKLLKANAERDVALRKQASAAK